MMELNQQLTINFLILTEDMKHMMKLLFYSLLKINMIEIVLVLPNNIQNINL